MVLLPNGQLAWLLLSIGPADIPTSPQGDWRGTRDLCFILGDEADLKVIICLSPAHATMHVHAAGMDVLQANNPMLRTSQWWSRTFNRMGTSLAGSRMALAKLCYFKLDLRTRLLRLASTIPCLERLDFAILSWGLFSWQGEATPMHSAMIV
jgi:hypothetical protein